MTSLDKPTPDTDRTDQQEADAKAVTDGRAGDAGGREVDGPVGQVLDLDREGVATAGLDDALDAELPRQLAEPGARRDDDGVVVLGLAEVVRDEDTGGGVRDARDGAAGDDLAAAGGDRVGERGDAVCEGLVVVVVVFDADVAGVGLCEGWRLACGDVGGGARDGCLLT